MSTKKKQPKTMLGFLQAAQKSVFHHSPRQESVVSCKCDALGFFSPSFMWTMNQQMLEEFRVKCQVLFQQLVFHKR